MPLTEQHHQSHQKLTKKKKLQWWPWPSVLIFIWKSRWFGHTYLVQETQSNKCKHSPMVKDLTTQYIASLFTFRLTNHNQDISCIATRFLYCRDIYKGVHTLYTNKIVIQLELFANFLPRVHCWFHQNQADFSWARNGFQEVLNRKRLYCLQFGS